MNKKYELVNQREDGLWQVRALRDFGFVMAGDLGGWIESEKNLSQDGYCWVYRSAKVYGDAKVYGEAKVYGKAVVTKCLFVQQEKHHITATDAHVFIGCQGHTWKYWFENINEIGRKHNYSTEEINDIEGLLKILRRQIKS